ncbi:glycoside hydrolase family 28 protein [Oligosphaera ethanolica]|uniref:Polygalacturonase n=1 Tax=Oligosphaera ethanolica TaxID=760260 RepID=A0AAE4APN5_9BACT|nr:glycosyl hydrolase family 28 protein [Oligosphaera ethanolica]MDQ0290786.1 polygalacturonase [Oligosphaera ethanolica]
MIYDIREYGALPGITALQTSAIQRALDDCAAAGGGTVLVPPGLFCSGSLRLRSHTTLCLENGATLRGPETMDGYLRYPFAWTLYDCTTPLLYAIAAQDVRICGAGCIDCNGRAFANTSKLCYGALDELPAELHGDIHYAMPGRNERPNRLLFFHSCEHVELSGVTLADAPTWTAVFHNSSHLRIRDLRIENDLRIPNSDGIHCCGCRDVVVSGCFFTCGDDCIALTSISDPALQTENVLISDCIFRSASSALRFGFEAGKVRNVQVRTCIVRDSNRGIAIFADCGGLVENIAVDGVTMDTRIYAGPWWGKGEPLVIFAANGGGIRGVSLRNAVLRAENSIVVASDGVGVVEDVELRDVRLELSYGRRRPYFGGRIDLAPNPSLPAPDASRHIPWLWTSGLNAPPAVRDVIARRAAGEKYPFAIAAM